VYKKIFTTCVLQQYFMIVLTTRLPTRVRVFLLARLIVPHFVSTPRVMAHNSPRYISRAYPIDESERGTEEERDSRRGTVVTCLVESDLNLSTRDGQRIPLSRITFASSSGLLSPTLRASAEALLFLREAVNSFTECG